MQLEGGRNHCVCARVRVIPFQGKMCPCGCDNSACLPWGMQGKCKTPCSAATRLWIKAISLRNVSSLPLSEHTYPGFQVRQITIYFFHGQVQGCPSRRKCVSLYAPLRLQTCRAIQKEAEKINAEVDFIPLISAIFPCRRPSLNTTLLNLPV